MSRRYKIVFLIRFLGYFMFFMGIYGTIFIFGPLIQAEFGYRMDKVLGVKRTIEVSNTQAVENQVAENFKDVSSSENIITPVSKEYGIVIEKINANAKVIPAVNAANEAGYTQALKMGVAEALGSTPPGEIGNLYLFSHSTDGALNIVRYNAVFFLLRELEQGDRVIIFYKNKRYDYIVFDKTVASAKDVSYLTNTYAVPVLTLQTCDPPGTLLNRLIVRARLVSS